MNSVAEYFCCPLAPGYIIKGSSDADTDMLHHVSSFSKFRHLVGRPLPALSVARAAVFSLQLTLPSKMNVAQRDR